MTRQNAIHREIVEKEKLDKEYRKWEQNRFLYYLDHKEEVRKEFQQLVDFGIYRPEEWEEWKPKRVKRW